MKALTGERLRRREVSALAAENLMLHRVLAVVLNSGAAVKVEGPWALRLIDGYAVLTRKDLNGLWVSTTREFIDKNIKPVGDRADVLELAALARYAQERENE